MLAYRVLICFAQRLFMLHQSSTCDTILRPSMCLPICPIATVLSHNLPPSLPSAPLTCLHGLFLVAPLLLVFLESWHLLFCSCPLGGCSSVLCLGYCAVLVCDVPAAVSDVHSCDSECLLRYYVVCYLRVNERNVVILALS
jgi:hypothetical protein